MGSLYKHAIKVVFRTIPECIRTLHADINVTPTLPRAHHDYYYSVFHLVTVELWTRLCVIYHRLVTSVKYNSLSFLFMLLLAEFFNPTVKSEHLPCNHYPVIYTNKDEIIYILSLLLF